MLVYKFDLLKNYLEKVFRAYFRHHVIKNDIFLDPKLPKSNRTTGKELGLMFQKYKTELIVTNWLID